MKGSKNADAIENSKNYYSSLKKQKRDINFPANVKKILRHFQKLLTDIYKKIL